MASGVGVGVEVDVSAASASRAACSALMAFWRSFSALSLAFVAGSVSTVAVVVAVVIFVVVAVVIFVVEADDSLLFPS